jgi:hypothetical protein
MHQVFIRDARDVSHLFTNAINMVCWTLNGIAITLRISVASGDGYGQKCYS